MRLVDSFVAVDAANLKDAFHTADKEALQVEFESDSHVEVDIERVVMSHKGTRRRAARYRVKSRTFHFNETFSRERLTY